MNLSELKNHTIEEEFVEASVEFKGETLSFLAKPKLSAADYEYIFYNFRDEDASTAHKRMYRLTRDAETNKRLSMSFIKKLPDELLADINKKLNEISGIENDKEDIKKK